MRLDDNERRGWVWLGSQLDQAWKAWSDWIAEEDPMGKHDGARTLLRHMGDGNMLKAHAEVSATRAGRILLVKLATQALSHAIWLEAQSRFNEQQNDDQQPEV